MATWGVALSPGTSGLMEFEEKRENESERAQSRRATAAAVLAAVCAWHSIPETAP